MSPALPVFGACTSRRVVFRTNHFLLGLQSGGLGDAVFQTHLRISGIKLVRSSWRLAGRRFSHAFRGRPLGGVHTEPERQKRKTCRVDTSFLAAADQHILTRRGFSTGTSSSAMVGGWFQSEQGLAKGVTSAGAERRPGCGAPPPQSSKTKVAVTQRASLEHSYTLGYSGKMLWIRLY